MRWRCWRRNWGNKTTTTVLPSCLRPSSSCRLPLCRQLPTSLEEHHVAQRDNTSKSFRKVIARERVSSTSKVASSVEAAMQRTLLSLLGRYHSIISGSPDGRQPTCCH